MDWLIVLVVALGVSGVSGDTRPVAGIRENTPEVHALVNATVVQEPGKRIERGTVVVRDGRIEAVGAKVEAPADARVWDLEGMTVYAGLIEPYAAIGQKEKPAKGAASHWNPGVHPEYDAAEVYAPTEDELKALRGLGFTAALVVPTTGILRGRSVLVGLGEGEASASIIRAGVAQHVAFERRSWREQTYPVSLMGSIALMRQVFLDAAWYRDANAHAARNGLARPERNVSLEALASATQGRTPVVFESGSVLNHLRAVRIGREFGLNVWIRGRGDEYRELIGLVEAKARLMLPLDYPAKPEVASADDELAVSLAALQHWEAAPANARILYTAGVPFVLTSSVIKKRSDFATNLRAAIAEGLPEEAALEALTTRSAEWLGVEDQLGTIEKGKRAHLVVTEGPLFAKETKVRQVWVDGSPIDVEPKPEVDPTGKWEIEFSDEGAGPGLTLSLSGSAASPAGTLSRDSVKVKLGEVAVDVKRLTATFDGDSLGFAGPMRIVADVTDSRIVGEILSTDRSGRAFAAERAPKEGGGDQSKQTKSTMTKPPAAYPLGAFGFDASPDRETVVVRNATIWTCGPAGIVVGDLLVRDGKVAAVGTVLEAPRGARVIDGTGKHVTPGLIDCHSHQGIQGGVNEGTEAVTCEVRTADVVYPWDLDIYRMMAGGLTVAHQLHGSSNPIGGQSSVIKLRWGQPAARLLMRGAKPGVKFALGENVKRSNWTTPTNRYPRTRMGVEQLIRDRFASAVEYRSAHAAWKANPKAHPVPRRDLESEALVEMVEGRRDVHAHSYRQDEILMLMRVAEDFGFRIGTFQHVLEGYKVADVMAKHGAAGSTFSDWWSYKVEAYDAIPHNAALMHRVGVNVSINSDSGELARRMNLEAAKAVKDGGVSEEEALKFVTLNPAIQLGIADRVGSLEAGKDGDFVVWSGHPLSTYSICERTWIDGAEYFSLEKDRALRERDAAERARLIGKVLGGKAKGDAVGSSASVGEGYYEYDGEEQFDSCHAFEEQEGHDGR